MASKSTEVGVRNQCFIEFPFQCKRKGIGDKKPIMWIVGRQITEIDDCGVNNMASNLEYEFVESQSIIV